MKGSFLPPAETGRRPFYNYCVHEGNDTDEDADRLAGWILAYAGRLPHTGETVTAQGVSATVTARRNRRILKVRLVRLEAPDREEEGLEAEEEAMEFDDAEEDAE